MPMTPLTEAQRAKGRLTPRMVRFSEKDLAKAAGVTVHTVKKDRQRLKFNPKDLASVAYWIVQRRAEKEEPKPE